MTPSTATQAIPSKLLKGGEFLISETSPQDIYTPEERTEEQMMFISMAKDFLHLEHNPKRPQIEKQEGNISAKLLEKCGEMGLLGIHMPEQYGGLELDNNTNTLIMEVIGPMGSFNTTFAAHTGIGMLPVLYYGTDAQKEKFLPRLITGELKAAYCLTEPGSGSDALAAKTIATPSEDGEHFFITGQKMWISNAGFANFFVVFAQVNGTDFTGFVIEGLPEGMSLGAEEDKLGIKGSSTRQVFFDKVKVSKDQVLGEIGKGHLIAFNTLNMGRFKLGLLCLGGCKTVTDIATKYALERQQFGQSIANFGAIKYKLAEMLTRTFAAESSLYRISDLINKKSIELKKEGLPYGEIKRMAAEEYAIECSIIKVAGSEIMDFIADENLQIHGGNGFSEEFSAARIFRDNRITRIYEGTNEINRLLIVDMLLRRAMKGQLDITTAAMSAMQELKSGELKEVTPGAYREERQAVLNSKKAIQLMLGLAVQQQMAGKIDLKKEQQLLTNLSDMIIHAYNAESLLLRIQKIGADSEVDQKVYTALLENYTQDANNKLRAWSMEIIAALSKPEEQGATIKGMKNLLKYPLKNAVENRKIIAGLMIEKGGYPLLWY